MQSTIERFFRLEERGTNIRTEVIAGLTTFVTVAYILAVNPSVLGSREWTAGPCSPQPPSSPSLAPVSWAC